MGVAGGRITKARGNGPPRPPTCTALTGQGGRRDAASRLTVESPVFVFLFVTAGVRGVWDALGGGKGVPGRGRVQDIQRGGAGRSGRGYSVVLPFMRRGSRGSSYPARSWAAGRGQHLPSRRTEAAWDGVAVAGQRAVRRVPGWGRLQATGAASPLLVGVARRVGRHLSPAQLPRRSRVV